MVRTLFNCGYLNMYLLHTFFLEVSYTCIGHSILNFTFVTHDIIYMPVYLTTDMIEYDMLGMQRVKISQKDQ